MRRIIAIIVVVSSSLCLNSVLAIGLGEVKINSHLNDRLEATIPIVNLDQIKPNQLEASIASKSDYDRLGLTRDSDTSGIKLSIKKNKSDQVFLLLHSEALITEPVMDLVISLNSPEGRLVRHYTLLMDPQGYPESSSVPKSSVHTTKSQSLKAVFPGEVPKSGLLPQPKVIQDKTLPVIPKKPTHIKPSSPHHYGPTRQNQTLWNVATQLSTQLPGTLPQVVWALYVANPNAFVNHDINRLKEGIYLNLPESRMMMNVRTVDANKAIQSRQQSTPVVATKAESIIQPIRPNIATLQKEIDDLEAAVAKNQADIARLQAIAPVNSIQPVPTLSSEIPLVDSSPVAPIAIEPLKNNRSVEREQQKEISVAPIQGPVLTEFDFIRSNGWLVGLCSLLCLILTVILWVWRRHARRREGLCQQDFTDNTDSIQSITGKSDADKNVLFDGVPTEPLDDIHSTAHEVSLDFDLERDPYEDDELPCEKSVVTKLDLARVYIEMDDCVEARVLLEAVLEEGDDMQRASAQEMLSQLKQ